MRVLDDGDPAKSSSYKTGFVTPFRHPYSFLQKLKKHDLN